MLVLGAWLAHTLVCHSAYQQFLQFPTSFEAFWVLQAGKPLVCLVQVFGACSLGIGGPHTKATLAINMKCAKLMAF